MFAIFFCLLSVIFLSLTHNYCNIVESSYLMSRFLLTLVNSDVFLRSKSENIKVYFCPCWRFDLECHRKFEFSGNIDPCSEKPGEQFPDQKVKVRGYWKVRIKHAYLHQRWVDFHQTKGIMIFGPFYTYL